MKLITLTSKSSSLVKRITKLQKKKFRKEFGQFVVENIKIIKDGLESGVTPDSFLFTPEFLENNKEFVDEVLKKSTFQEYYEVTTMLNQQFSSLDSPSGVAAVYSKPENPVLLDSSVIYLNGVSIPGNVGAIMRTALSFGFKNIVLDNKCADAYNPKTVQAAKDAIFKLNIVADHGETVLNTISEQMPIVTAVAKGGKPLGSVKQPAPFCLVLGSESHGVSSKVTQMSTVQLSIPVTGEMESLNVAAAAAIIIYAMANN